MKLPDALAGVDLGEAPLGTLLTAGVFPFHTDTGELIAAPVWFVVCATRGWLVAASAMGTWSVGSAELTLDKGWTWDAVVVGAWSAPLKKGTRGAATSLFEKWEAAPKGGTAVDAPRPTFAPGRAPAARGADQVPSWIPEQVPAEPDEHWLFAFESAREHGFGGRDGQIHKAPTWLALTDQRVVVTAEGPSFPLVRAVTEVTLETRTGRRDLVVADGWALPGALVGDRRTGKAAALAAVSGRERWAAAVELAIESGESGRAVDLVSNAFVANQHGACWAWIGLLTLQADPHIAVGAVGHLLAHDPTTNLRPLALKWASTQGSVSTAPPLPAGVLAECGRPELPEGLPVPQDAYEAVGTAALIAGQTEVAAALWAHRGDTPRAHQCVAVIETLAGDPRASRTWMETAQRWRNQHTQASRDALSRAISLATDPAELQWTAAAWAHQDGEDPTDFWDAVLHTEPPDTLVQSLAAWRDLARFAEHKEAWPLALTAWSKVRESPEDLEHEAQLLEQHDDLEGALQGWRRLAEAVEAQPEPSIPRWKVWTEIGRLCIALSALGEAQQALIEAVRGDFLVPEAYQRALDLSEPIDIPERAWWAHILAALTSNTGASPRAPASSLARDVLDGLHPGGVGWLEGARHSLDTSEPPPRADLVRGLERIEAESWPELFARIESISKAVGIEPPATYLFRGEGAWGLSAWPTEPPLVLVGHDHLNEGHPQKFSEAALHFALAVEIVHLAEKHPLLAFDGGLVGTSRSVYQAFGKYAGAAETVVDVMTLLPGVDQLAKIQTLVKLSKRVFTARSVIDKATGAADTTASFLGWSKDDGQSVARAFEGAALQFRLQADRAALLLTGDLNAAIEAMLRGDPELARLHESVRKEGVLSVLALLDPDTRLRLAGLLEFAAGLTG